MEARQPLISAVEGRSQGGLKPLFSESFGYSRQVAFRKICQNAGLQGVAQDLLNAYLQPVLDYLNDLQIRDNVVTGKTGEKSFNRLLNLIETQKEQFSRVYANALSSSAMSTMLAGFDDLEKTTKQFVRASYAEFMELHNEAGKTAQDAIAEARWNKLIAFCCIVGCAGWCPLETVLTVCNCCYTGCDDRGICWSRECSDLPKKSDSISCWAPMGSMSNMFNRWREQDQIIEAKLPDMQRMI